MAVEISNVLVLIKGAKSQGVSYILRIGTFTIFSPF